ncbi:AraC family transcriptional regulator [Chryseobacterium sp. T16E-39]|uniref:AraC family transcriptional regulator n=1 Tax=Chryseobacterium sp. T16E-39 TaxID=2015076 RepID=UPI000B5B1FB8|nr:helix-turn-helix domain-containing protein [Chryseobacterium sp. T16E-39]ASK29335.1 AraC family transcriptional regulator [Chryseobacterium sp. T16E-39]
MKSLQFSVPADTNKSIRIQEDIMTNFYPHFHRHTEIQIMWIIKGHGVLAIEQNLFNFKAGDIFYLGANQSHVFKGDFNKNEKHKVHAVSIFFHGQKKISAIFDLPEFEELKHFIANSEVGFQVAPTLKADIAVSIAELQKAKSMDQILNFVKILTLLMQNRHLHIPLSTEKNLPNHISDNDKRIIDAQNFIKKNFAQNKMTLDTIAKEACMTPQAFCRSFKKRTGITYIEYLNELRVQRACKLLTSSTMYNISSVAFNSGFNSLTNFNRVFRLIMKYSPKEYLKHYKETILE